MQHYIFKKKIILREKNKAKLELFILLYDFKYIVTVIVTVTQPWSILIKSQSGITYYCLQERNNNVISIQMSLSEITIFDQL